MKFVETPVFTGDVRDALTDEEYRQLQLALLFRPEQGALNRGGGGLRKIRWRRKGRGKRGSLRIIYYWHPRDQAIYLLMLYEKSDQDELTPNQAKTLSALVRKELK